MASEIKTAIILAGGLGTRLRSVIDDLPKPLADINGKPFLALLIDYLIKYEIKEIILATGYLSNQIEDYFRNYSDEIEIKFSIEEELLGTGGAINLAVKNFKLKEDFLLLNGDSILTLDIKDFISRHFRNKSRLSIALKKMEKPYRYGTVELNNNMVIKFKEKDKIESGLINTGVYLINPSIFKNELPIKFSFEQEILEKENNIHGFIYDDYFVDIGIPEDYQKAKKELVNYLN